MASLNAKKFADLLIASGLVREQEVTAATADFSRASAIELAAHLVSRNLLTPWQAEKLLQGKYKGYFLDDYKLLDLVDTTNVSLRYRAEHVPTSKFVILNIGAKKLFPTTDGKPLYVVEEPTTSGRNRPSSDEVSNCRIARVSGQKCP
jgi:hypothetical protein